MIKAVKKRPQRYKPCRLFPDVRYIFLVCRLHALFYTSFVGVKNNDNVNFHSHYINVTYQKKRTILV